MLPSLLLLSLLPCTYAASGSFDVLAYNVAGLPQLINNNGIVGGKRNAAPQIGQEFARGNYDIIHVQEDFAYHRQIYREDNHPHRTRTSGNVPIGSGLNTLANFPWNEFERITWDDCWINSGDCLTRKGFSFMRMEISEGVTVDLYNLHADAGSDEKDIEARNSNFRQVASYIDQHSQGQAVLVFGDFNALYSNPAENIRIFFTESGLRDPWVDFQAGGTIPTDRVQCDVPAQNLTCESIDKVLYRSGDSVNLVATGHVYATNRFLQEDGNVLSDHDAILVDFDWETSD